MSPKYNAVANEVNEILEVGIIPPASSAWSIPVVIGTKEDGRSRFFVDYRKLNRVMKLERRLLQKIEDLFDHLAGARVFMTLDLYVGHL